MKDQRNSKDKKSKSDKSLVFAIVLLILFLIYFFAYGKNTKFGWLILEAGAGGFVGTLGIGIILLGPIYLIGLISRKFKSSKNHKKMSGLLSKTYEARSDTISDLEPKSSKIDNAMDNEIYETISIELDTNSQKKGLWTKAIAEADGDENKTKSIYIKLRFKEIKEKRIIEEKKEKERRENFEKIKNSK